MSNGLGDTIASVTEFFGLDKVADALAKLAGAEGCGCKERKEYLNQLFPYETYRRSFIVKKSFIFNSTEYLEGTQVDVTKNHPLFPAVLFYVDQGDLEEI